jgi:fatty acid desaturase
VAESKRERDSAGTLRRGRQYAQWATKAAILVGIYVIPAVGIGLAYSWSWAAVVILFGLVPVVALMFAVRQFDRSPLRYFDQNDPYQRR